MSTLDIRRRRRRRKGGSNGGRGRRKKKKKTNITFRSVGEFKVTKRL